MQGQELACFLQPRALPRPSHAPPRPCATCWLTVFAFTLCQGHLPPASLLCPGLTRSSSTQSPPTCQPCPHLLSSPPAPGPGLALRSQALRPTSFPSTCVYPSTLLIPTIKIPSQGTGQGSTFPQLPSQNSFSNKPTKKNFTELSKNQRFLGNGSKAIRVKQAWDAHLCPEDLC